LNFISALLCPHYDVEEDRKVNLRGLMKRTPGVGIAIDNCCAIEIVNGKFRIINSKPTVKAFKTYWKGKKYVEEKIEKINEFFPLSSSLVKE